MITISYYNIKKNLISFKTGQSKVSHTDQLLLSDATLYVREGNPVDIKHGTRQWTIEHGQKCVHAYVKGQFLSEGGQVSSLIKFELPIRCAYNPYRCGYFFNVKTGSPLYRASIALVTNTGVWLSCDAS